MKKIATILMATFLIAVFSSCDDDVPSPDMVCCESYGFGAMMAKCCEEYEWKTIQECAAPEDFVGGGMEIVDDPFCQ